MKAKNTQSTPTGPYELTGRSFVMAQDNLTGEQEQSSVRVAVWYDYI